MSLRTPRMRGRILAIFRDAIRGDGEFLVLSSSTIFTIFCHIHWGGFIHRVRIPFFVLFLDLRCFG